MKRKLLAMLLAVCMVVTLIPMAAVADTTVTDFAEINGTKYSSIADLNTAIADSSGEITITLLKDAYFTGQTTSLQIPEGKTVILNTGNYTLSSDYGTYTIDISTLPSSETECGAHCYARLFNGGTHGQSRQYCYKEGGTLTITGNGTIDNVSSGSTTIRVAGTLNVGTDENDSSTLTITKTQGNMASLKRSAIKCEAEGTVNIYCGTIGGDVRSIQNFGQLNIYDGTMESFVDAWHRGPDSPYAVPGVTSTLNIVDGTFEESVRARASAGGSHATPGNINISGGEFKEVTVDADAAYVNYTGTKISGGTFTNEPDADLLDDSVVASVAAGGTTSYFNDYAEAGKAAEEAGNTAQVELVGSAVTGGFFVDVPAELDEGCVRESATATLAIAGDKIPTQTNIRVNFSLECDGEPVSAGEGAEIWVETIDPNDPIKEYNLLVDGFWGPRDGFPMPANYVYIRTMQLWLTFDKAGTYVAEFSLVDMNDNQNVLYSGTATVRVKAAPQNPEPTPSEPPITPTVTENKNGTITVSPAPAGSPVAARIMPRYGFAVDTVSIIDAEGNPVAFTDNGDGTYTFTMPEGGVTISATYKLDEHECPSKEFTDLDTTAWYHEALDYVLSNGIMTGTGDALFTPGGTLTRAMMAQILYNLEGQPAVASEEPFTDVEEGDWYYNAVVWAYANKVTLGTTETTFSPGADVTRQQVSAMLYRYAEYKGYDLSAKGSLSSFTDGDKAAAYAVQPMEWAIGAGVFQGNGDGTINPNGTAKRTEIAQIMMNFCKNFVE